MSPLVHGRASSSGLTLRAYLSTLSAPSASSRWAVTTLVALVHELEPYDSNFVHLRELSMEQISAAIERMSALDVAGIAALPGVQPKRASVILAGAVVIRELMRAGGYKTLTVSENSLLAGMAATINEVLDGATPTIAWTPTLSTL